jgi:hypothetical protein
MCAFFVAIGDNQMTDSKFRKYGMILLLAFLLHLPACGGGGDNNSGGMDNSSLNGNYRVGNIGADDTGVWSGAFDITFDGNGQSSGTPGVGTYSVQSDGVLDIGGSDTMFGQVSQDGTLFHLTETLNTWLAITLGIKEGSGMSVADLNGTYHVFFLSQSSTRDLVSMRYSFEFDGTGNITSITPLSGIPAPVSSATYTVSSSGAVLTNNGDEGQVSANGDIFFVVNTVPYDYMAIGVRQSTGMSTADVAGTFHSIKLRDSDSTDDIIDSVSLWRANLVPDGAGNLSITPIDPTGPVDNSGTISVGSAGTITASYLLGQVSPDTGFFVFVDDDTVDMDGDYEFAIGILKP